MKTYQTIVADPNWGYQNFGAAKHGAAKAHYKGSTVEQISAVPVGQWARPDSILLLWATLPKLDEAIDVMRNWGFSLVTALPWTKTTPTSEDIKRGIGFWFYSTTELLLVCRKGKAKAPKQKAATKPLGILTGEKSNAVFYAPLGPHSRKPLSLTEWIESTLPGPYLELYARVDRPGWTCYGNEIGWWLDERGATRLTKTEENLVDSSESCDIVCEDEEHE